jgi:arylsulfatase A-like enzyme
MLGEHDWWAKNKMPLYNEIANIPLFIYHPDYKNQVGERRSAVTQNIDLMPTFLELNNNKIPKEVQGKSLLSFLEKEKETNHTALFGYWGGGVNLTDGKYTFFNYPENMKRTEANQYTLMPTHLRQFFTLDELKTAKLNEPFSFTKGVPVLKIQNQENGPAIGNDSGGKDSMKFEDTVTSLYDITIDPGQLNNIIDSPIKAKMLKEMKKKMIENDAPKEVLQRFGF